MQISQINFASKQFTFKVLLFHDVVIRRVLIAVVDERVAVYRRYATANRFSTVIVGKIQIPFLLFLFFEPVHSLRRVLLNLELELFDLGLYVLKGLVFVKYLEALLQLAFDFVEVLHALTLHRVDVFKHNSTPNMRFVNLIVQPLVHRLFWFAEPRKQIWVFFHLLSQREKMQIP